MRGRVGTSGLAAGGGRLVAPCGCAPRTPGSAVRGRFLPLPAFPRARQLGGGAGRVVPSRPPRGATGPNSEEGREGAGFPALPGPAPQPGPPAPPRTPHPAPQPPNLTPALRLPRPQRLDPQSSAPDRTSLSRDPQPSGPHTPNP